jgi:RNA polymerase sigma-70 factor (ECF subfamily)
MRSLVHSGRRISVWRGEPDASDADPIAASKKGRDPVTTGVLQHLGESVLDLAEPYIAVILLRYFEGLSIRDIADNLHIPIGTVKTRLKVARAVLRQGLDDAYHGDRTTWARPLVAYASPVSSRP